MHLAGRMDRKLRRQFRVVPAEVEGVVRFACGDYLVAEPVVAGRRGWPQVEGLIAFAEAEVEHLAVVLAVRALRLGRDVNLAHRLPVHQLGCHRLGGYEQHRPPARNATARRHLQASAKGSRTWPR